MNKIVSLILLMIFLQMIASCNTAGNAHRSNASMSKVGQSGMEKDASEVLQKFIQEDLNGARLSSNSYIKVEKLIAWDGVEPGWDTAFVCTEARQTNIKRISNKDLAIEVRYAVVGILAGDEYEMLQFNEVVDFWVCKQGNGWKITESMIPPHISISAAIANLEELIQEEKNGERRDTLVSALNGLRDQANAMQK